MLMVWIFILAGAFAQSAKQMGAIDATVNLTLHKKAAAQEAGALTTINGTDYATATSYDKRDWAGSALPTVYGSISSALSWKNWDLNMLFTYSLGGKTYDGRDVYKRQHITSLIRSFQATDRHFLAIGSCFFPKSICFFLIISHSKNAVA